MLLQFHQDFSLFLNQISVSKGEIIDSFYVFLNQLLFSQFNFIVLQNLVGVQKCCLFECLVSHFVLALFVQLFLEQFDIVKLFEDCVPFFLN